MLKKLGLASLIFVGSSLGGAFVSSQIFLTQAQEQPNSEAERLQLELQQAEEMRQAQNAERRALEHRMLELESEEALGVDDHNLAEMLEARIHDLRMALKETDDRERWLELESEISELTRALDALRAKSLHKHQHQPDTLNQSKRFEFRTLRSYPEHGFASRLPHSIGSINSNSKRFEMHQTKVGLILLDNATGRTWLLNVTRESTSWKELERFGIEGQTTPAPKIQERRFFDKLLKELDLESLPYKEFKYRIEPPKNEKEEYEDLEEGFGFPKGFKFRKGKGYRSWQDENGNWHHEEFELDSPRKSSSQESREESELENERLEREVFPKELELELKDLLKDIETFKPKPKSAKKEYKPRNEEKD